MSNQIAKLTALGQSLWYDNIERSLLENGALEALIKRGEIRGITSNPSIFKNAIANSNDYDTALLPMAWSGWGAEQVFWQLAVEDIQEACDLFLPLYEESKAGDGYVSLEVNPFLAHDTTGTIEQVRKLWERVDRPNLMVKIPATPQGIPAIRHSIAAGINVNVTLIFSLDRYSEVMEAYISGLEERQSNAESLDRIASVASFFVSRVDTKVDARLPDGSALRGKAAVANARLAYSAFLDTFAGPRWAALQVSGARVQRPLWASTSTKDPAYSDTLYVDSLIGADTVNTVPPATLNAFRDHGVANLTISEGLETARDDLAQLASQGIVMQQVTQELEDEGVKAFADAFSALIDTIDTRRQAAVAQLGALAPAIAERVSRLEADKVPSRLWQGDATLWANDPGGQSEVNNRLGWLRLPETSRELLPALADLVGQVKKEGIRRILLLGMGGSSLAPEVLSNVFAKGEPENADGTICLAILDSTDPAQVAQAAEDFPPDKSLYIVSSKSGGTAEVAAMLEYFWQLSGGDGRRFVAVTDPGTSLARLAEERVFRKIFRADPDVGGRYSALTAFGLVPGALLGLDLERLLLRAGWMMKQCRPDLPAARNPGIALGAVLAESALHGRDKLTILTDASLISFGSWLEQLIAESSGKKGKGILPVDRERLSGVEEYAADRLFIYLRQAGQLDSRIGELRAAGHPVLEIPVPQVYDLGTEFYRWEFATSVACHILGVNAFDQPDVEDAKLRAKARIAEYRTSGRLEQSEYISFEQAKTVIPEFLKGARLGDYVALNAFLPRQTTFIAALQDFRVAIRYATKCATTLGFGPRYLHSTGQMHKGGPNTGLFLIITADPLMDIEIPSQGLSFGTLQQAQALGDIEALKAQGRRVLRLHLSSPDEARQLGSLL